MKNFSEILKSVRREASLTQQELADMLGMSKFLIVKLETGTREPSKKFISDFAKLLKISPLSLTPFLFSSEIKSKNDLSGFERKIVEFGEKFQSKLLMERARTLSQHH